MRSGERHPQFGCGKKKLVGFDKVAGSTQAIPIFIIARKEKKITTIASYPSKAKFVFITL